MSKQESEDLTDQLATATHELSRKEDEVLVLQGKLAKLHSETKSSEKAAKVYESKIAALRSDIRHKANEIAFLESKNDRLSKALETKSDEEVAPTKQMRDAERKLTQDLLRKKSRLESDLRAAERELDQTRKEKADSAYELSVAKEDLQAMIVAKTDAESEVEKIKSELVSARQDIETQQQYLTSRADQERLDHEGTLCGLRSELRTAEGNARELQATLTVHRLRLDLNLTANANLIIDKAMLEAKLESLQKKHDGAETMVTTLQEVKGNLDEDVATWRSKFAFAESGRIAAEERLRELVLAEGELAANVDSLEYEVHDLKNQRADAEKENRTLLATKSSLDTEKTALSERLQTVRASLQGQENLVQKMNYAHTRKEDELRQQLDQERNNAAAAEQKFKTQQQELQRELQRELQAKQNIERAADETSQGLKDQIIKLEQDLGQTRQAKQTAKRAADEANQGLKNQLGKKEQDLSKTLDEARTLTGLTEEIKRVIVSAFVPLLFRFTVGHTINTMGDRILRRRYPLLTLATPRQAPRNEGVAWSLTVIDPGDFAKHRTRESWDGPGTLWIHSCCTSGPSAAAEVSRILEHMMDVYNYMNDDELHLMLKATHQVVENLKEMAGLEEETKWRMLLASLRCVELLIRMGMSSSANRHILQGYRDRIETARQQSRVDSLLIQAMLFWIDEALTDPSRMEGMIEVLVGSTWERMVTTDGRHLVFADDTGHILVVRPGVGVGVVSRYDTDTEVSLSFQGLDHHGLEFGVAMRRDAGGKPVYRETLWSDRNHENNMFVMGLAW
ncbi:hypothetical protein B0A49_08601 [Cryomyces minteri]|uniref:Uncharacterized protein n=1 Tax=Cryomyces minteri TaxID=331657 RepID=A0A4U0WS35_9PEZI|nr:hypothetical protein B0A49_08601 [Cryomyces minteri]